MTKKDCSCSCFSCFLGRNTPSTSAPESASSTYVDTNTTSPTIATRHDPQTPASTSKSYAQLKSVDQDIKMPSYSSSAHQDASPFAVVVKQDEVVLHPPSGDAFSAPSHLPCVASFSSTVPETAISSYSSCVPTVAMPTEDIHHSQQSVASSTQPGEAHSSPVQGMSSFSSICIKNKDGSALEGDNVEVDLDGNIEHISQRLELIQGSKKSSKRKGAQQYWPTASKTLFKLKEFVSEGINVVMLLLVTIKTAVSGVLQGMGTTHLVTAGLVVVANILERFEEVDANKAQCLCLMREIIFLAKLVKHFQESPQGMYDVIKEATELVVEGYIMCCCQID